MKSNSRRCTPAVIALVVTALIAASLEPAVFAADADKAPPAVERVGEQVVPAALPNRPVFEADRAVAQATPPRETVPVAPRPMLPASAPAPQQTKSSSKKWIWIVAAAGAAGAAAFLARGNGQPQTIAQTPTITVGTPSVGQPQ